MPSPEQIKPTEPHASNGQKKPLEAAALTGHVLAKSSDDSSLIAAQYRADTGEVFPVPHEQTVMQQIRSLYENR